MTRLTKMLSVYKRTKAMMARISEGSRKITLSTMCRADSQNFSKGHAHTIEKLHVRTTYFPERIFEWTFTVLPLPYA
jgi:hypothetical protein